MASQSTLLGAAGEHHVMTELLRRGYIAALAPQGVPNADIVVTDVVGTRLCTIQVKTRRDIGADGGWHMKQEHEKLRADRLFYCFVHFGKTPDVHPIVHVVPSGIVADVANRVAPPMAKHARKVGEPHKDGPMRRLLPDYAGVFGVTDNPYPRGWLDPYRDAWHVLKLESTEVEQDAEP